MFKNILAIALVVAMLAPGLSALANDRHVFPLHFFPTGGYDADQRWEYDEGSLTIVRTAGPYADEIGADHQRIPGVPIRIERVQLVDGAVPNAANLSNEAWVRANTESVSPADVRYGVTNANGEVVFEGLDLGIWLVREVPSLTVTQAMIDNGGVNLPAVGATVINPVNSTPANIGVDDEGRAIPIRFQDFLVGIPRYTGTAARPAIPCTDDSHPQFGETGCVDIAARPAEPGDWDFDVTVYPKSTFPPFDNTKELTDLVGDVATWTLTHQIPHAVENLPHFGVTDIMSAGLSFRDSATSVTGRFETAPNVWRVLPIAYFDVTDLSPAYNGIHIAINALGRAYLGEHGLAVAGDVQFFVESYVNAPGQHSNVAVWNVGTPPTDPPCQPGEPDCPIECPIDADCDDFYAFLIELLKVNEADQALEGAEFALYRELTTAEAALARTASSDVDGRYYVNVGTVAEPNIIYVYNAGTVAAPIWVTPFLDRDGDHVNDITGTNGITTFGNIALSDAIHSLWLREVEAPEGYRIIDEWMSITLSTSYMRPGDYEFDYDLDEDVYVPTWIIDIEVLNVVDSGWQLPDTGGMGTIVLTVVGLALVGGALVLFLGGKKDEEAA